MTYSAFILAGLNLVVVSLGMKRVIDYLHNKGIIDVPNHRSSHDTPTPRGAGLLIIPTVLVFSSAGLWQKTGFYGLASTAPVLAAAFILFMVSWRDDTGGLSAVIRLSVHAVAVSFTAVLIGSEWRLLPDGVPFIIGMTGLCVAWVWFINLFNFMDGIDGISGVQTVSITIGILVLDWFGAGLGNIVIVTLCLLGAALGFLFWNWHPARIFLGDSGSIPIGFLLAWLLIELWSAGYAASAIILPMYYLTDSGLTLVRRGIRGDKIWHAHREHAYQKAVANGWKHYNICSIISFSNLLLIAIAIAVSRDVAIIAPHIGIILSLVVCLGTYWRLHRHPRSS